MGFSGKISHSRWHYFPNSIYRNIDFYNSNADFSQRNNMQLLARGINLSLQYKFGKLNASIKKNKRGINNDDLSGGGR